jgi:hypothetical protein
MKLQLLYRTTCLTVYYDQYNEWLFLDWEGDLTLLLVQEACTALATCFLHRSYSRVLNSNEQVTGIHWDVTKWLITDFMPHLALAGIEYVAWIHSTSLRGQHMVQTVLDWLASPRLNAFSNAADAVTWLQQLQPSQQYASAQPRSPANQARLTREVKALLLRINDKQQKRQQA